MVKEKRTLIVESLDIDLSPAVALLAFPSKSIIFELGGRWYYLMSGRPSLPRPASGAAVYGTAVGDHWAVSEDVLKLINWSPSDVTA